MLTYQMKVRNSRGLSKTVHVVAPDFHKAVAQVKSIYGNEWFVYESQLIGAR